MTQPDRKSTVSISQLLGLNGARDSYIFSVTNRNEMVDGDSMTVFFPPEITLSNDTNCAARSRVRGFY